MKARKIELKTAKGESGDFPYREGLLIVITSAGPQGINADDLLKAMDIKQELNKATDALHLTEVDYNWLVRKLNEVRWNVVNEQLAEFIKDIRGASLVDVEAKC